MVIYQISGVFISLQKQEEIDPTHISPEEREALKHPKVHTWRDIIYILVFLLGSILYLFAYIKCVSRMTERYKRKIFNFISMENIRTYHERGIHWSIHPKLIYLRLDLFSIRKEDPEDLQ